jgi:tRNA-modifying protein YgfZ
MSSVLETSAPGPERRAGGRLPHLGLLRFAGPDAVTFLQGQVSNDTRVLTQGSTALLAAYSNAQGRVIAVVRLVPHSSGVIAILPRELVLPVLERLRKFVLRAKVKIEDVSGQFEILGAPDAAALDTLSAGAPPAPDQSFVEHRGTAIVRVPMSRPPGTASPLPPSERFWVIRPRGEHPDEARQDTDDVERAWRLADIRDGVPQVYLKTSEEFVAQMLNLDLLDGISFSKGCYTGQEIIARTQHRGRIKRRMFRLQLPAGSWTVGQALRLADGRSGTLVEAVNTGESVEALAVLTLEGGAADGAAEALGLAQAVTLPLPYSL